MLVRHIVARTLSKNDSGKFLADVIFRKNQIGKPIIDACPLRNPNNSMANFPVQLLSLQKTANRPLNQSTTLNCCQRPPRNVFQNHLSEKFFRNQETILQLETLRYCNTYSTYHLHKVKIQMASRGQGRGQYSIVRQNSRGGSNQGNDGRGGSANRGGGNRGGGGRGGRGGQGQLRAAGRPRRPRYNSQHNWAGIRGFTGSLYVLKHPILVRLCQNWRQFKFFHFFNFFKFFNFFNLIDFFNSFNFLNSVFGWSDPTNFLDSYNLHRRTKTFVPTLSYNSFSVPNNYSTPRPFFNFSFELPHDSPISDYDVLSCEISGEKVTFDPAVVYKIPFANIKLSDLNREFESIGLTPNSIVLNDGEVLQDDSLIHSVSDLTSCMFFEFFMTSKIFKTIGYSNDKPSDPKFIHLLSFQVYCHSLETWLKLLFFSFYRIEPYSWHSLLAATDLIMCTFSSGRQGHYDIVAPPAKLLGKVWGKISRMSMKRDTTLSAELLKLTDDMKSQLKNDGKCDLGPDLHEGYIFRPEELESGSIIRGKFYNIIYNFHSITLTFTPRLIKCSTYWHNMDIKCLIFTVTSSSLSIFSVSRININNAIFNRTPEQHDVFTRNFTVNRFWIRRNQTRFEPPPNDRLNHVAELPDLRWVLRNAQSLFATTNTDKETAYAVRTVYRNMKKKYGLDNRVSMPESFHEPPIPMVVDEGNPTQTAAMVEQAETRILNTLNQRLVNQGLTISENSRKVGELTQAQQNIEVSHAGLRTAVDESVKSTNDYTLIVDKLSEGYSSFEESNKKITEGCRKLAAEFTKNRNRQDNINQCLFATSKVLTSQVGGNNDKVAMIGTVLAQAPATRHVIKTKCPDLPGALGAGNNIEKFQAIAQSVKRRADAFTDLLSTEVEHPGTLRAPIPEPFGNVIHPNQLQLGFQSLPNDLTFSSTSSGTPRPLEDLFSWNKVVDGAPPSVLEEIASQELLETLQNQAGTSGLPKPDLLSMAADKTGIKPRKETTPGRPPLGDKTMQVSNQGQFVPSKQKAPTKIPLKNAKESYDYYYYYFWHIQLLYLCLLHSHFSQYSFLLYLSHFLPSLQLHHLFRMTYRDPDRPTNFPGLPYLKSTVDNDAPIRYRIRDLESEILINQYKYLFFVIPGAFLAAIETIARKFDLEQFKYLKAEAANLSIFVTNQRDQFFKDPYAQFNLCFVPNYSDKIVFPKMSDKLFHLIIEIVSKEYTIHSIEPNRFHSFYHSISNFTQPVHNHNLNRPQREKKVVLIPTISQPDLPKRTPDAGPTPDQGPPPDPAGQILPANQLEMNNLRKKLLQKWNKPGEPFIISNIDLSNIPGDSLRETIDRDHNTTDIPITTEKTSTNPKNSIPSAIIQMKKILRISEANPSRSMIFPPKIKTDKLTSNFRDFILTKPQTLSSLADPIDEAHVYHHCPRLPRASKRKPPPQDTCDLDVAMDELAGLIIVSANLNKASTQIDRLVNEFPNASVFNLQELNVDSRDLLNKTFFPAHFHVFFHKPVYKGRVPEVWSCILVRNNIVGLTVKQILAPTPFTMVLIECNHHQISICNFYRPHYDSYRVKLLKLYSDNDYDDYFQNSLAYVLNKQLPLTSILVGDVNLQLIDPRPQDKKPLCRKLTKMLVNYTNLALEPTHVPHRRVFGEPPKWSTIDVFMVKNIYTHEPLQYTPHTCIGSDGHQILSLNLQIANLKLDNTITIKVSRLAKCNEIHDKGQQALKENMVELMQLAEQAEKDIIAWQNHQARPEYKTVPFCQKLFEVMEDSMQDLMPSKTVTITVNQTKYLFSPLTKLLRRVLFYLERLKKNRGRLSPDDEKELRLLRIFYRRMSRRDRRRKALNIGDFDKLDKNDIFRIRDKLNPKNKRNMDTGIFTVEELADYYRSKFGNFEEVENFEVIDFWEDEQIPTVFSEKDFVFSWYGPNRGSSLRNCFLESKEYTKGYNSCLNRKIFSSWPTELIPLLLKMQRFNVLLGICPEFYHKNKVVAIPKFGSPDLTALASRRILTVQNFICSGLSKQVSYLLNSHSIKTGLFSDIQHGFTSHRSVVSVLGSLLFTITEGKRQGKSVVVFSLDAKRAYDSIRHSLIILRTQKSCSPTMARYIESFLENRSGFMVHRGRTSDEIKLAPCGVPQGGCESPALFNLVIAGIHKYIPENTNLLLYADDITCVLVRDDMQKATEEAQKLILNVRNDLEHKGVYFHEQKTAFLAVGKKPNTLKLKVDDNIYVDNSEFIRILGVNLYYNLSFEYRINDLLTRIDLILGLVYSLLP